MVLRTPGCPLQVDLTKGRVGSVAIGDHSRALTRLFTAREGISRADDERGLTDAVDDTTPLADTSER